jgi:hypothetical protein
LSLWPVDSELTTDALFDQWSCLTSGHLVKRERRRAEAPSPLVALHSSPARCGSNRSAHRVPSGMVRAHAFQRVWGLVPAPRKMPFEQQQQRIFLNLAATPAGDYQRGPLVRRIMIVIFVESVIAVPLVNSRPT